MSEEELRSNEPALQKKAFRTAQNITYANILAVNGETQTMNVSIVDEGGRVRTNIPINNMVSSYGTGIKVMPVPGFSFALLLKDGIDYKHIGYYVPNQKELTENRRGTKNHGEIILQRYLESGEIQVIGLTNNEILLSNDGSILLKAAGNSYLKLEDFSDTLEGSFSNVRLEMDGVRLRSGNIKRPVRGAMYEDDYIVKTESGDIKSETELEEVSPGEYEPHEILKEFTVQVGTLYGEDGLDVDFDQRDPTITSPSVGLFSIASQVIDENGRPIKVQGQNVQILLRTAKGGGIAVTEDNSLYLLDYRGRNFTKFASGDGSKSLRAGDKTFVEVGSPGISIQHECGGAINVKPDADGKTEISITDENGRNITLNKMGLTINIDGGYVNIGGKEINFNAEKFTFGGALAAIAGDTVFKAKMTAAMLDTHIHAGPSGPPVVPLTTMVLSGQIASTGINVG